MKKATTIYMHMDDTADAEFYTNQITYLYPPEEEVKRFKNSKYKYGVELQPVFIQNNRFYRIRTEIIIIDKDKILIDFTKPRCFPYSFPGGGIEKNEDVALSASRECEEEALIRPKNVEFVNIAYFQKFPGFTTFYHGSVSLVCVGQKDRDYKGYIKKADRDEFVDHAKWVPWKKVALGEPHMLAIYRYLEKHPISFDFSKYLYKKNIN